mmetsp:Transcript_26692/g.63459  ORF Transcript_26692/g.63459 Transcript_26692/m.63459 type:complete len:245 (-) Transcript_26692:86-820(-)
MNCVLPSQTMTKRVFRLCMRGLLRITAQPVCGSHMLLMSSNATQRVMQEARRKKSCCARRETLSRDRWPRWGTTSTKDTSCGRSTGSWRCSCSNMRSSARLTRPPSLPKRIASAKLSLASSASQDASSTPSCRHTSSGRQSRSASRLPKPPSAQQRNGWSSARSKKRRSARLLQPKCCRRGWATSRWRRRRREAQTASRACMSARCSRAASPPRSGRPSSTSSSSSSRSTRRMRRVTMRRARRR